MATSQRDDRIAVEAERGTRGRAFEQRGVFVIAHKSIGDGSRERISRPTRWNAEAL
jgi:hypothetical protein